MEENKSIEEKRKDDFERELEIKCHNFKVLGKLCELCQTKLDYFLMGKKEEQKKFLDKIEQLILIWGPYNPILIKLKQSLEVKNE